MNPAVAVILMAGWFVAGMAVEQERANREADRERAERGES